MRFRIQTDGEKFRVQRRRWFVWWYGADCYNTGYMPAKREYWLFHTYAKAEAWIDNELNEKPPPKWRTI